MDTLIDTIINEEKISKEKYEKRLNNITKSKKSIKIDNMRETNGYKKHFNSLKNNSHYEDTEIKKICDIIYKEDIKSNDDEKGKAFEDLITELLLSYNLKFSTNKKNNNNIESYDFVINKKNEGYIYILVTLSLHGGGYQHTRMYSHLNHTVSHPHDEYYLLIWNGPSKWNKKEECILFQKYIGNKLLFISQLEKLLTIKKEELCIEKIKEYH